MDKKTNNTIYRVGFSFLCSPDAKDVLACCISMKLRVLKYFFFLKKKCEPEKLFGSKYLQCRPVELRYEFSSMPGIRHGAWDP